MKINPIIPTFPTFMRFRNGNLEFQRQHNYPNPGFKKVRHNIQCQPIKPEEPKLVFKGVQDNPNGKLNFIA